MFGSVGIGQDGIKDPGLWGYPGQDGLVRKTRPKLGLKLGIPFSPKPRSSGTRRPAGNRHLKTQVNREKQDLQMKPKHIIFAYIIN